MSLHDFTILSRIGEGTYSSVWQAKRHSDNEIYALKKVKLGSITEKEKHNALNEVRLLASINNPYVVSFKEAIFEDHQTLCIIMEYVGGGDIYNAIIRHQRYHTFFKEKDLWKFAAQMIMGLKALHDKKILHRDLKCANVFLAKDGSAVKLGDLNVSKVAKNKMAFTQTGTPYYASPEVWRNEPYDMKSDVWSLGCVLYEMCALKPPFRADDMPGLFKKVQKGVFDKLPSQYSSDLTTLISLCLQVKTGARLSCDELLAHPVVQKNCGEVIGDIRSMEVPTEMLQTIRLPKNTKNLRSMRLQLPKANYPAKSVDSQSQSNSTTSKVPQLKNFHVAMDQQAKQVNSKPSVSSSIKNSTRVLKEVITNPKPTPGITPKYSPKNASQAEISDGNNTVGGQRKMSDYSEMDESRYRNKVGSMPETSREYKSNEMVRDLDKRKNSDSRLLVNRREPQDIVKNNIKNAVVIRNKSKIEKKGLEGVQGSPIDAMERRAQQMIQKYHDDAGAAEKREGMSHRGSPVVKSHRELVRVNAPKEYSNRLGMYVGKEGGVKGYYIDNEGYAPRNLSSVSGSTRNKNSGRRE